jgi:hypothetical protein
VLDQAQRGGGEAVTAGLVAGERRFVDDDDVETAAPGRQAGRRARRPGTHHEDVHRR